MTSQSDRPKDAFIIGERVWLRLPTEQDAKSDWYDWFNDPDVAQYTGWIRPNTPENQIAFLESRVLGSDDLVLAIIEKETGKHIGIVSLSQFNYTHGFADIALIVGDAEARGKANLGLEAFSLMIRHGFLRMNLRNIKGGYISGQKHSEAILKALRFEEYGRAAGLFHIDGIDQDQVLVRLKREDWLARNPV